MAVVLEKPEPIGFNRLELTPPGIADVVVDIHYSGISTGTEKLLWTGSMPMFPGMGYPLVPGYESVGRVVQSGLRSGLNVGDTVFVPGASCYGEVKGLFGGSASQVIVPAERVVQISDTLGDQAGPTGRGRTCWFRRLAWLLAWCPPQYLGRDALARLRMKCPTLFCIADPCGVGDVPEIPLTRGPEQH
jgi:2-desacetyl-2-hydroxyethyl bacteriochlorophyllide A dehydrogenase